jgi:hypothetical protein
LKLTISDFPPNKQEKINWTTHHIGVVQMIKCNRCEKVLSEGESYDFHGETVCEDCYMMLTNPPKACDPMAVASALSVRRQLGQEGVQGLSDLQKKICELIEEKGRITKEELSAIVGVTPEVLEREFAVLRHCELVRAFKEGHKIFLTKW